MTPRPLLMVAGAAGLFASALATLPSLLHAQTSPPVAPTAPAPATSLPITFFGEVRSRSEWDRPDGPATADAFTYLRSRVGARIDPTPGTHVVLQLQDSRVLGAEGSRSTTATERLELHQGYVELSAPWRDVRVAVRAGRQEIALGNERLVGAVGWSNVGRSFDGARLLLSPRGAEPGAEPWSATAYAATVEERGRHFGATAAAAELPDHAVAGLYAARALSRGAILESTLLYDAGADFRAYRDAHRATLNARLRVPRVLGVRAELEGAVQVGRQRFAGDSANVRAQDVRAWLLGARVGTPVTAAGADIGRASAMVGVDVLSGDASPIDGRYGAFGTMYATNHPFYGLMDLVGDPSATTKERGLVDALATGSATITRAVALRAELHRFALATGTGSGSGRDLGWEADLTLPVRLTPTAGVGLGYSAFRAGAAASSAGLGTTGALRHWAYLQLRAGF
jgi:hypothetical protein